MLRCLSSPGFKLSVDLRDPKDLDAMEEPKEGQFSFQAWRAHVTLALKLLEGWEVSDVLGFETSFALMVQLFQDLTFAARASGTGRTASTARQSRPSLSSTSYYTTLLSWIQHPCWWPGGQAAAEPVPGVVAVVGRGPGPGPPPPDTLRLQAGLRGDGAESAGAHFAPSLCCKDYPSVLAKPPSLRLDMVQVGQVRAEVETLEGVDESKRSLLLRDFTSEALESEAFPMGTHYEV